jgi:transposase
MKPRRQYTQEFKDQAIELVNSGKSVVKLAGELGVGSDLIYAWKRKAVKLGKIGSGDFQAVGAEVGADELAQLRRENATLRVENDILKKAAVILGTENQPKSAR